MAVFSDNLCRAIKDTYRDFAENTSIHGTINTIGGTKFTRFIWTIIVLSALGVSVYMLLLIWWRFTSGPTITYVESAYGSNFRLPFPAVTICNNNKIMPNKVDAFVNTLNLYGRRKEDVAEALPQILSLALANYHSMNTDSLKWLKELLIKNGYDEFKAFLKITQSCDELLLRCKWEGRNYSCSDLFVESFTINGRCCTFNSNIWDNRTTIHTEGFGYTMGLIVVTNNTEEESQYNAVHFLGITVIVHNALELPRGTHLHRTLSTGSVMFFQIFGSILEDTEKVRSLPYKQRKCIYSNESHHKYFPLYSDLNCLTACQIRKYSDNCQCVPYVFKITGIPLCHINKLKCLQDNEYIHSHVSNDCVCPTHCESIMYKLLSSGSDLVNDNTATSNFLKGLDTSSSSLINVFFPRETYTHIKRGLVTDEHYILSSLGGIFGLLLGCSFTSVAEILYEILIRFVINWKVLNKVRTTEKIMWMNKPRDIYYDKRAFYN